MDALLQHTTVPEAAEYLIGIDVNQSNREGFSSLRTAISNTASTEGANLSADILNQSSTINSALTERANLSSIQENPQPIVDNNLTSIYSTLSTQFSSPNQVNFKKNLNK